jgi:hypothetical protein
MTDAPEIVDEKAAAEIRSIRARKALVYAPGLAEHMRRALTPADGRTERGFAPGDRTPLNTAITDAADELYVLLYGWAQSWAAWLRIAVPTAPVWRDRAGNDPDIFVEYFCAPISTAELRGDDVSQGWQGIDVYCEHCNWAPEFSASKMVRWLRLGTTEPVSIEEVTQTKATLARSHESVTVWKPHDAA